MTTLKPGKGLHHTLTQEVLDFASRALENITDQYSDKIHDGSPKDVLDDLVDHGDFSIQPEEGPDVQFRWEREKDDFGDKAFVEMPFQEGALRITVVLTKKNELKLDIRSWYQA
jgi:hypothetical protein